MSGALTEAELVEKLRDVHVLGIRSKMHVSAEAIKATRRLLAIGCFCIGTNQVDLEVGTSPLYCAQQRFLQEAKHELLPIPDICNCHFTGSSLKSTQALFCPPCMLIPGHALI